MPKPTFACYYIVGKKIGGSNSPIRKGLIRLMLGKQIQRTGENGTQPRICTPQSQRTIGQSAGISQRGFIKKPYEVAQYVVMKLQTKIFCFASVNFEYT